MSLTSYRAAPPRGQGVVILKEAIEHASYIRLFLEELSKVDGAEKTGRCSKTTELDACSRAWRGGRCRRRDARQQATVAPLWCVHRLSLDYDGGALH